MRKIPPFLLLLVLSACSIPETRWEKAGADEQATKSDLLTCRQAAQQETFISTPYYGLGYGFGPYPGRFHRWNYFYESDRLYAQGRLTDFCMRNKGYQLVTIQPPQTRPPAPTPAPAAQPPTTDK
ncbi:MAG: hypothetical protein JSR91_01180 [Proteobacteria bacterium]|nr:hypothetical protein [Pseudomonadota bacterium]